MVSTINQLLSSVNSAPHQVLHSTDLHLTPKDIEAYKKLITEKEKQINRQGINYFPRDKYYTFPGENTDFNFYRAVADSINSIPDSIINKIFSTGSGNLSTTTNWIKLTLEFQNDQKLTISNQDDKPNYLHTPWIVNFEGLLFKTNSMNIGRQIDLMTGGAFFEATAKDKKYALFQIADYLYREILK